MARFPGEKFRSTMLKRPEPSGLVRILSASLCSFLLLAQSSSFAAGEPTCVSMDSAGASCLIYADKPLDSQHPSDRGSSGNGAGGRGNSRPIGCRIGTREVPCSTALGSWSSYASAWCRTAPEQPDRSHPIWAGQTTGSIYACTRPGFDGLPNPGETVLRWLPGPPEAAAAPDPEDLARRLLASIDFQAPEIGMFPRGDSTARMSYVGWHMWLWAAPSSALQWGPVTDSITEAGVSVTLTARVTGLTWNMGDGGRVSCAKGTAWSEAATGGRNVASPDCGYVYRREGRHTVTVTSDWAVEWAGGGRSGSLPFSLSRSTGVLVGEMQSVHRDA